MRAPKEVIYKLQFFMELLHGGVCEQSLWSSLKYAINQGFLSMVFDMFLLGSYYLSISKI
jgi:hypothetical protein